MRTIFNEVVYKDIVNRINNLNENTKPQLGKNERGSNGLALPSTLEYNVTERRLWHETQLANKPILQKILV